MKNHTGTRNFITISICLLFCGFVIGYELYARQQAQAMMHQHARFIADAVWNVNHQGTTDYLRVSA